MPFGPFKKKKKKDLPNPPSITTEDDFQSPLVESRIPEPPKVQDFQNSPSSTDDYTSKKQGELQGPPRLEGPPREGISSHPHLPPPPTFGSTKHSSPSSFNRSIEEQRSPLFGNENATEDILRELKQTSFGSDLEKAPTEKNERISVDEFNKRRLQETKRNYITAGDKQLELKFYNNAATNFACAILLDLISEGYEAANQTKTDLSRRKPSAILDNLVFDSVRLIIEAVKTRNYTFFSRAEKNLKKQIESMYPEDAAIIENGIKAARALIEL